MHVHAHVCGIISLCISNCFCLLLICPGCSSSSVMFFLEKVEVPAPHQDGGTRLSWIQGGAGGGGGRSSALVPDVSERSAGFLQARFAASSSSQGPVQKAVKALPAPSQSERGVFRARFWSTVSSLLTPSTGCHTNAGLIETISSPAHFKDSDRLQG